MAEPTPPRRAQACACGRATPARRLLRAAERALAVTGALLLLYQACFGTFEMVSPSMSPALHGDGVGRPENDWVLYERVSTRWGPPPRWKLLAFVTDELGATTVTKRVVAYAGERVTIDDGKVVVDGRPLDAPDGVRYVRAGHLRSTPEGPRSYEVPAGTVLVLGDNTQDSWDGRFFGGLAPDRWRGRPVAIVWPPARWRWVW